MAARANPSQGGKPDKIIRQAIILELNRMMEDDDGNKIKKIQRIATKLVDAACEGKIDAIKEIGDRVDGKPAPQIAFMGDGMKVSFVIQDGPQTIDGSFTEGPLRIEGG